MRVLQTMREQEPRHLLWALWVAILAVSLWCFLGSTAIVGHHFVGFRTEFGGVVSAIRANSWGGAFHFGDRIVSVGGESIANGEALQRRYDATPAGTMLLHEGLREGKPFAVKATVRPYSWQDWWGAISPLLSFGVVFMVLGLIVAWRAGGQPEARTLSMLSAAFFLAAVATGAAGVPSTAVAVFGLASAMIGGLLWRLGLQLAHKPRTVWWPIVLSVVLFAVGYAAIPMETAAFMDPAMMDARLQLWNFAQLYWSFGFGVVGFVAMLAYHTWTAAPMSLAAQRSRVILFGALFSFLPVTLVWVVPLLGGGAPDPAIGTASLFSLVLFPLAVAFAVLRYKLFEIEIIIKRTLSFSILAGLLAIGYTGAMTATVQWFGAGYSEPVRLMLFMGMATTFDPLRRWIRAYLDRAFDRGRLTTTEVQRLINRRALEHRDTSQTLDGIARDLGEVLKLERCGLALAQGDQFWTVAGDMQLLGISLPVASLPPESHWDRQSHPDYPWPEGIEALVKVNLRERLVAVLLLGEKRSQEPLSGQDYDYLGLILGQIGVLLSYTQVLDRQAVIDREMQVLLKRVSELNDLRASFGIVAGHELRTPLTVIRGHAEALLAGAFGYLDDEQRESVGSIFTSATRLGYKINSYLDLVALRENRMIVKPNACDIGTLVGEVLETWGPEFGAKEIAMRVDVSRATKVYADPKRLRQIIEQLLSNAVKFTPAGGSVWIAADDDVACVKLKIGDSGPGIPPDRIEQVFEDFVQAEEATKRDHEGLGIGLPLAKGLAEAMHGWIAYSPAPGHGAIFTLALPISPTAHEGPGLRVGEPLQRPRLPLGRLDPPGVVPEALTGDDVGQGVSIDQVVYERYTEDQGHLGA